MKKKIVSIILVLILLSASVITFAADEDELKDKKNDLKNDIKETEQKIDQIQDKKDEAKSEIEKLNDEIAQKSYEVDVITEELNKLNREVSKIKVELEEEQKKYDDQYEALKSRMIAQYKIGSVSYLDVLLNASSLTDFISRYYIIEKVASYDSKMLDQIEEKKEKIETSKTELEKKQNEVKEKQSKLKLEEIKLSNKREVKNDYINQLSDEEKELEQEKDKLEKELKTTENELAEIARKAAAAAGGGGFVYTGGKIEWPCPNYSRISSYFGYRGSAATGGVGSSNHKGIDIAAAKGNSIIAAEDGVVIKVSNTCSHNYAKTYKTRCKCGGGYGNYLMVSHGSLVTIYAHCTSILVSNGQKVKRGQQIATVGCTGYSTGNHLHFGTLLNGTYVNPMQYFNK